MKKEVSRLVEAAYEAQDFLSGIGNFTVDVKGDQVTVPALSLYDLVQLPAATAQFTQNLRQPRLVLEADIQKAEAELSPVDAADFRTGQKLASNCRLANRLALKMSTEQNPAYIVAYHNLMGLDYTVDVAGVHKQAELACAALRAYAKSGADKASQAYGLVHRLNVAVKGIENPVEYKGPLTVRAMIATLTGKPAKRAETEEERKRGVDVGSIGDALRQYSPRQFISDAGVDEGVRVIADALVASSAYEVLKDTVPLIIASLGAPMKFGIPPFGQRGYVHASPQELATMAARFISTYNGSEPLESQLLQHRARLTRNVSMYYY